MKFRTIATAYILFVFFIPNSIALINKPGIPLLSVSRVYVLFWVVVFLCLFYKRKSIRQVARSYPFYKPMSLIFLSMLIVTVFALNTGASANVMLAFLMESFLLSVMIWVSYRKPEYILDVMRRMVIIFVGLAIYGTASYFVGVNPVMEFVDTYFASESKQLVFSYADVERLGTLGRANSIFPHPMQYGAFLVMAICLSYYRYIIGFGTRKYLNFPYILILLCGLASTFSRTPILFLLITALIFWLFQSINSKLKITAVVLVFAVTALTFSPDAILQLTSSVFIGMLGGQSDVGGSSMVMRAEQLVATMALYSEAPIVGHGLASTRIMIESGTLPVDLRQAESELFSTLIDAGIVGLLATIYFYFFLARYFLRQKRASVARHLTQFAILVFALVLGYVSFILATGVLGTFQLFIIIITLAARYLYLRCQENPDPHQNSKHNQVPKRTKLKGFMRRRFTEELDAETVN